MKISIIIAIALIVGLTTLGYLLLDSSEEVEEPHLSVYHGPVPLGFNETHFRKTGETILNGRS